MPLRRYRLRPRLHCVKSWFHRAVATFEATEAAASVVFTTLASVTDNNYFEQLKFKYESHDYIAVTHNR